MEKQNVLFINACVRRERSRTLVLAKDVIKRLGLEVTELNLEQADIPYLEKEDLDKRDALIAAGKLDDPMFFYARQFAEADTIIIAAPFWDIGFPAMLKAYLEYIMVSQIAFDYVNGIPKGLCKAKKLYYITTCGGPVFVDFGLPYIKVLAQQFFGIPEVIAYRVQNTDVFCYTTENILTEGKIEEIRD